MVNISPFHGLQFKEEAFNDVDFLQTLIIKDHTKKKERVAEIIPLIKILFQSSQLEVTEKPVFYILQVQQGDNVFTGLVTVASIDPSFQEHEHIHLDKKEAYYEMAKNEGLQINPILGVYRKNILLQEKLFKIMADQESQSFKNGEQIYHWTTVEKNSDIQEIQKLASEIETVFIGDGHHRFHVMQSIYGHKKSKAMFFLVDEENITFKSCHRLLFGEINFENPKLLNSFNIKNHKNLESIPKNHLIIVHNDQIYELIPKNSSPEDLRSRWPHVVFDEQVLPFLGKIKASKPIGGNIKYENIFDLIKENLAQGAVLMPSLPISDFFDLVSRQIILPPSSTWFEPKIMEGFISMSLNEILKN